MAGLGKPRGKAGKWRIWYVDETGRTKWETAFTDKKASMDLANRLEQEARLEREGLVEPGARRRRQYSAVTLAAHVEAWRDDLIARGRPARYAKWRSGAVSRVFALAGQKTIDGYSPEAIARAADGLKAEGLSACSVNFHLGSVRSFYLWLQDTGRIREQPIGIRRMPRRNVEADRRRVRRALTRDEFARLVAAAEAGGASIKWMQPSGPQAMNVPGPDRAFLYRLAVGTGFRANELRSLRPSSFRLDGDQPAIHLAAKNAKNGKAVEQPISRDLAARCRDWLASGRPLPRVPVHTARMLAHDLEAAGIAEKTEAGVVDFHSLRATYITWLAESGVDVATLRELARHHDVNLTIGIYTHVRGETKRRAVEAGGENS